MTHDMFKRAGLVALAFSALASAHAASAQTVITTAPPDPLVTSLRDRVDALESQVRTLTGDNERLQYELQRSKEESVRLQRTIDDMNQQAVIGMAPPAPAAASGATVSAAGTIASGDAATAFNAAYDFIRKSDFAGAEGAFRSFVAAYPKDAKIPDARFYLGQTLLQRGAASDAAEQFVAILKNSPKADRAPEAMVRLGVALNRMGEKAQACGTLQALPGQYPKAAAGVKASAAAQIKAIGC